MVTKSLRDMEWVRFQEIALILVTASRARGGAALVPGAGGGLAVFSGQKGDWLGEPASGNTGLRLAVTFNCELEIAASRSAEAHAKSYHPTSTPSRISKEN